jgi:hypothetical protein
LLKKINQMNVFWNEYIKKVAKIQANLFFKKQKVILLVKNKILIMLNLRIVLLKIR